MKRIAVLIVSVLPLTACTWITEYFRGDENIEPPRKLVEIKQARAVEKVWAVDIGQGSEDQLLRLTPAVDKQHVYVASRDGKLQSYKLSDGSLVWEVSTDKKISAGPAVGQGLLLVGTRNAEVLAFNKTDGKPVWSATVSSEVLSVPAIGATKVVVRAGDGSLIGLQGNSGKQLWHFRKREPALTLRGTSKPVIAGKKVLNGFDNGQLLALNVVSGRQVWVRRVAVPRGRTELERIVDLDADPVVLEGRVYVAAYQGNVASIDLSDGQLVWQRELSSYAGMTAARQQLYVTDDTSQVWALHTGNGASLWRQDELQHRLLTAPALYGKYIVVGDFEGYLHWLDQQTGKVSARTRGDSNGYSMPPVVSGTTLVSLGRSGELSAFRLK